MEFEFDKEIDALLRKSRTGEIALADDLKSNFQNPQSFHLDADDISAFAENALPEKTKLLYMSHLADCGRCRRILSNIISLNSEAELETASSAVSTKESLIAEPHIPWYRKLFVFPQLAYTMGALVLVFSSFLAYLFVQNSARNNESSSVSQVRERPQNMSGASSDGETSSVEISRESNKSMSANSMSNSMSSAPSFNTLANAANTSANTNSSTVSSNTSAAPRKETSEREKDKEVSSPITTDNQPAAVAAPPPPPAQSPSGGAIPAKPAETLDDRAASQSETESKKADKQKSEDSMLVGRAAQGAPMPKTTARKMDYGETKSAGGRNFTRKNGVWYDANYKGQSTTNVSRGSDDYKKLDAGVRSIADNLGGTVVIVSKDKAYRIQ